MAQNIPYNGITELEKIVNSWISADPKHLEPNDIKLMSNGAEMIKITDQGFWVRGIKVVQDDKEAETVYNAFKEFLVWSELNRQ